MLCSIAAIAAILPFCHEGPPVAVGHVEGEYVLVAPIEISRVEKILVERGQAVSADQPLVELERRDAEIIVAQAEAARARAQSQLADLTQGARPAEIEVAQAVVQAARADAQEAERDFRRVRDLFDLGVATKTGLDAAQSGMDMAKAKLREAEARLDVPRLPARSDRIAAAEAALAVSRARLDAAR